MPISISCPQCHRKYQVRDELAGKVAKCPCGQTIPIPTPAAPAIATKAAPAAKGVPVAKPATAAKSATVAAQGTAVLATPVAAPRAVASATPVAAAPPPSAAVAPPDLFGQLAEELAAQPPALQPLGKRKKGPARRKGGNPYLIPAVVGGAVLVLLVVTMLIVVLSSGGSPTVASPVAAAPPPPAAPASPPAPVIRWKSPQEVFEAGKQAIVRKDWKALFEVYTPTFQSKSVRMAAAMASMMAPSQSAFRTLCRKHGIDPIDTNQFAGLHLREADIKAIIRKQMEKMEGKIADEPGFFVDFLGTVYDESIPDPAGQFAMMRAKMSAGANATLENLQATGDSFTATAVSTVLGFPENQELQFYKINGEWRIEEVQPGF